MKKIFSLLLVVSMLFAMVITANAAYSMGFTTEKQTVKVGEEFDVVLEVNVSDGDGFAGGSVTFSFDGAVAELVSVSTGSMTEGVDPFFDEGTCKANKTFTAALTESGTFAVATFKALAPSEGFVVKADTKSSFSFKSAGKTKRINGDAIGTATIKIEAAEEEKKPTVEAVDAKETDVIIDNTQYMGTAIYEVSFDLENTVDATKGYGIKVGGTEIVSSVTGDGTVNYVLAFYGITGAAPDVQSFWTAK